MDMHATPLEISKFLQVTERSVWRWLKDDSAPYAVLAALWHETPAGRHTTAVDVGNELVIHRGLARATAAALEKETARLGRLCAISDTGAANEPFLLGVGTCWQAVPAFTVPDSNGQTPASGRILAGGVAPLLFNPVAQARKLADDKRGQDGPSQDDGGLLGDFG